MQVDVAAEVAVKAEGGFRRAARRRPGGRRGALRFLILLVCFAGLLAPPAGLQAAEWPWSKPDEVSVQCTLDREQIVQDSGVLLGVKVEATDSREHDLAYAWSVNGGRIVGEESNAPEAKIDLSGVNPGVYSVLAVVQDAYEHSASCVAHFQVVRPTDILTMSCASEPAVVAPGEEVAITAEATDSLGHPLHYRWFSNAGRLQGEGPAEGAEGQAVRLHTDGLSPGVYTVTGRVEDGWGGASDCIVSVKVEIPPPPPPPPAPQNMAQIIFGVNRQALEPDAKAQLEKVLARLREEPTGIVSIESYAGPEEQNPPALSAARGETVKRYLLEKGAEESRLQLLVGVGGGRGGLSNRTLDVIWLPVGFQY
ncbi:MAG: hypothetical protein O7A06_11805 [Acidobacteria bacterium]|nr:hypothetical protein [Acidobacteriota bacterium]